MEWFGGGFLRETRPRKKRRGSDMILFQLKYVQNNKTKKK